MKIFKYLSLALVALFATSCEEHEIVFDAEPVASDRAFVQVFYMNPMTASSSNYVYKLHLDGVDYVNNYAAVMANYNGAPGGVARFYTVKSGDVSIKLYWGFWEDRIADPEGDGKDFDRVNGDLNGDEFYSDDYSKYVEKYSNTIRGLEAGKYYDVFIYDFEKDPIVIASGFPFESNVTEREFGIRKYHKK
ncbi:MAG: hypothetical protein J6C92_13095 [Bacteroidaceae bacterium]|nr:hypothetical protein [Bacteroidaceae bacterium]